MKTNKFLLGLFAVATLFVGCADDDTADVTINQTGGVVDPTDPTDPTSDLVIGGTLTEDLTLATGEEYSLESALIVPEGITLTVEPGVVVRAVTGSDVYIAATLRLGGCSPRRGPYFRPGALKEACALRRF